MTKPPSNKRFPWHLLFFLGPGLLIYLSISVYPLLDTLRLGFLQSLVMVV
jgi:raffinose/stachyose/melibiose transport system permease protein